ALPNLETLALDNADLSAEDIHAIAVAFPKLVTLDIGDNEQRVADLDVARLLAEAPALRRLRLSRLGLDDRHAEALAASPDAARLVQIDLSTNKVADTGALALSRSPYLSHLRRLSLAATMIGHDAKQ